MSTEVEAIAPSVGVETAPAAPPTATAVDEQIAQPVEGQPVGETPSTEVIETQPETEVDLDVTPEGSGDFAKFKPAFEQFPELRSIVGREQAFSEIAPNGSFRELKGIVERVPTLEDAETLASAAADHRALGETFRRDPVAFTESLKENDPLAFSQLARQLPEILAETDATLYSEQARYYSNAVLDNLFAIASRSGNEQALISLQNVAQMLGVQLGAPRMQARGDSEADNLRKQLAERDEADNLARASSFWDGANDEYTNNITSEIEALIKKSIPTVTDGQLKRMSSEVWEGINTRLGQQPQTMAQIERFKQDVGRGRMGLADHRTIVDFSSRRARQLMPLVLKEVSSEWSKQVLALNKEQIDKKKAIAATTREVATGGPTAQGTAPAMQRPGGPKKTFKSVFEALTKGTYNPPRPSA